jgi:hypothetical protein
MYRRMQPEKNWTQYPFFSVSVLANGFNDRSARMQPATASSQISFLQVFPVGDALGEPGAAGYCARAAEANIARSMQALGTPG